MKIMLDAGHGPETPGKRSPDGMREFDFNNAVANAMKAELEQYAGVTVLFAHEPSRDVPLKERTDRANAQKVDVYVSLHANANTGVMGNWTGIETYVYKTNPAEARKLADKVQKALVDATGLFNRGVKTADFHVLRETNMTSILIEHGYMDSHVDLPKLKDASFRTLCGVTNAKAVAEVYGLKRKASTPTPTVATSSYMSVEKSELIGRTLTIKTDKLWYYNEPRWDVKGGEGHTGDKFIITEELSVNGARMVKCHDGKYRTADPAHVDISPKPSDWPYRVFIDGITHAQAAEIVNEIHAKYKNAKAEGQAK